MPAAFRNYYAGGASAAATGGEGGACAAPDPARRACVRACACVCARARACLRVRVPVCSTLRVRACARVPVPLQAEWWSRWWWCSPRASHAAAEQRKDRPLLPLLWGQRKDRPLLPLLWGNWAPTRSRPSSGCMRRLHGARTRRTRRRRPWRHSKPESDILNGRERGKVFQWQ